MCWMCMICGEHMALHVMLPFRCNRINWRGSHLILFSYLNTNICFVASSVWTSAVEFVIPPLCAGNENSQRTRKAHFRVRDAPACEPPCSSFYASMKIEPYVSINDKDRGFCWTCCMWDGWNTCFDSSLIEQKPEKEQPKTWMKTATYSALYSPLIAPI